MKKALAIFLSALLICIMIAPMGAAVTGPALTTKVIEGEYSKSANGVAAVTATTFTIVVTAPAVENLTGVNLYFEYDPAILKVKSAGFAADADGTQFFPGVGVTGLKAGVDNQYAFAWIPSGSGVSKADSRDLLYITFNVLDTTKAQTPVYLYIDEFRTDDASANNDVTSTILFNNSIVNFNYPENTPPAEDAPVVDGTTAEDGTTADDINALLQLIRDMLNGNGVTFADFADAIANTLGNAEITDIVEQLVDGDMNIADAFADFLKSIGLDFSMFEKILNTIIEFLAGLFGGDDSGETEDTTAAAGNDSTTAAGSSSGSEKTGDKGVALAATVCVVSSAAFVLTRKKKEII
ncbi:MAG: hypothetical protein J6Q83_02815 [Clostridia bacterium]|nr:hypothetical protein [Clostridia bacterium]